MFHRQWGENREKCNGSAENIFKLLEKSASIVVSDSLPAGADIAEKCVAQLRRSYEPSFGRFFTGGDINLMFSNLLTSNFFLGGFSPSPKFPQPGNYVFLLDYCVKESKSDADQDKVAAVRKMIERSLSQMAKG